MKTVKMILIVTVLVLVGMGVPNGESVVLAAEIGSKEWHEENRQREQRIVEEERRKQLKALQDAIEAKNEQERQEALEREREAAREREEAEERRDMGLEPIP